jgi:hypothetical protein
MNGGLITRLKYEENRFTAANSRSPFGGLFYCPQSEKATDYLNPVISDHSEIK